MREHISAICCFYSGEQRLFSLLFGRQRRQKARVSAGKTGLVAVFTLYYQRKQRPGGSRSSTRGSSLRRTPIVTAVTSARLSSAARRSDCQSAADRGGPYECLIGPQSWRVGPFPADDSVIAAVLGGCRC